MIKCCVFDLDGTLFNTLPTITYYVNKTLGSHGIAPITEEECKSFIGHGARHLIFSALGSKGIIDESFALAVLSEYNAAYNANTLYLTKLYDGIKELVASLRESGITLAILSNKPDATVGDIVSRFFREEFALVRGARDGVPLKPAPDSLLLMFSELGCTPDEVAYIGDTGVDVDTARAAGVALSVGVSWGFRSREELVRAGADVIADTPNEVFSGVMGCV